MSQRERQLPQDVWGPTYLDQTQYLRRHLLAEPGVGYRFQP